MTNWNTLLASLGFSNTEAALYLAALELGPSPVQVLAKRANVSRATTYEVINALQERGLMSSIMRKKRRFYVAEPPERLLAHVESRVKDMHTTLTQARAAIEELSIAKQGEKPTIKIFEGREAMKALQDDILESSPDTFIEFGSIDSINAIFDRDKELNPFQQEIMRRKMLGRGIYQKTGKVLAIGAFNKVKQLSDDVPAFFGHLIVYNNKVALSTFRGRQILALIEAPDLADMMRIYFEQLWKNLPE